MISVWNELRNRGWFTSINIMLNINCTHLSIIRTKSLNDINAFASTEFSLQKAKNVRLWFFSFCSSEQNVEIVIHRSPVNSPHKSQWPGALMVSLICAWTNSCANNRDAFDLRRRRAQYNDTVMVTVSNMLTLLWQVILLVSPYYTTNTHVSIHTCKISIYIHIHIK